MIVVVVIVPCDCCDCSVPTGQSADSGSVRGAEPAESVCSVILSCECFHQNAQSVLAHTQSHVAESKHDKQGNQLTPPTHTHTPAPVNLHADADVMARRPRDSHQTRNVIVFWKSQRVMEDKVIRRRRSPRCVFCQMSDTVVAFIT